MKIEISKYTNKTSGRYRDSGNYSGEWFLEDILWSALKNATEKIEIIFDARVMRFSNIEEAINCLLFRQRDHIRNSISGYTQYYFSHKEIDKKNSDEKIEMMKAKGFDWNELDCSLNWSKFGTFLWKENVEVVPNGKESYIRTAILERSDNFDNCIKYIIDLENNLGPMRGYPEEDWFEYKKENC